MCSLDAFIAAVVAGIGFVGGVCFRIIGPLFALLLLALSTYRSSWGQVLWLENVMVLQVLIVGFSRSADALAWRPGRRRPSAGKDAGEAYGVPVRLAALVTVATYLLSVLAKFRLGGTAWMFSDSLRNHVAGSVARAELLDAPAPPLGRWLVAYEWVFPPMAVLAVLVELASPIALVQGEAARHLGGIGVAHARVDRAADVRGFPVPALPRRLRPVLRPRTPHKSRSTCAAAAPESGRRDLNPRPPAPKAGALPLRHSP